MRWNFVLAKQKIAELGLRRKFVADKIGLMPSTFNQYLMGNGRPSIEVLDELAKLLGIETSSLITDQETAV